MRRTTGGAVVAAAACMDVNGSGTVVGTCDNSDDLATQRAFRWSDGERDTFRGCPTATARRARGVSTVAPVQGVSEQVARKRVSRALAALRGRLAQRP